MTTAKFEELIAEGKDYQPSIHDLGSLYLDYSKSIEEMKHEFESCIHLFKNRYQSEAVQHQTGSVNKFYQEFVALFKTLPGNSVI